MVLFQDSICDRMSSTTYLSKYVHTVIVEYGHNFTSCIDNYLSHNLTYNWQRIGEEFGPITGDLLKITLTFIYLVVLQNVCHTVGPLLGTKPRPQNHLPE